jgi:hypothetical protein
VDPPPSHSYLIYPHKVLNLNSLTRKIYLTSSKEKKSSQSSYFVSQAKNQVK